MLRWLLVGGALIGQLGAAMQSGRLVAAGGSEQQLPPPLQGWLLPLQPAALPAVLTVHRCTACCTA